MLHSADADLQSLYKGVRVALRAARNSPAELVKAIVEAPFQFTRETAFLFLGFICYYVVDEEKQQLRCVAVTDNEYYRQSVESYPFEISEYVVPLSAADNTLVQAITSGEMVMSADWESLKREGAPPGVAKLNQASGGIGSSVIYPLGTSTRSALMFNFFALPENIGIPQRRFIEQYVRLVEEALGNLPESVAG